MNKTLLILAAGMGSRFGGLKQLEPVGPSGEFIIDYSIYDAISGYSVPDNRIKPWGTAHAILCAKDVINEPFAIINADDFYGKDAYRVISEFMDKKHDGSKEEFGLVGYKVINTLTLNGTVKRGVCVLHDNHLVSLDESVIEKRDNDIYATSLVTNNEYKITNDT